MSRVVLLYLLCILGIQSNVVFANTDVTLEGKITSKITAFLKPNDNLFVTDDKGGWFDQGLEMTQPGGWETPYEVQARLRIISSSGKFQVRLDEPLLIRNTSNAAQLFRQPKVNLGAEGDDSKTLAVGQGTEFQNPPQAIEGDDSVGYYNLIISAFPPDGTFRETTGIYNGVLSLTFEPVIIDS